jgi:hypothetical protein
MPSDEQLAELIRTVSDLKMRMDRFEQMMGGQKDARAPLSDHGTSLQQAENLVRKGKEEQRAEDQIRREQETWPGRD